MDLQRAKELFLEMGCSHFHMAREKPELYEQYRNLNITHEDEAIWRQSVFNELFEKILQGDYKDLELWSHHAYLCELALKLNQVDSFQKILDANNYVSSHLPKDKWVLVSERLISKGIYDIKKSLIFFVYRICGIEMAKEYLRHARQFCTYSDGMDYERCLQSQDQCIKIEEILFGLEA
ncbi:hypothetical protein [Mangrovibacterium diazotrophicum]|uniref:Uncharacterized protein n=1 Tax=Mangrovibacterium diazotrophicum TaxID=1261403 RepID=A0A419VVE5_9BACT|nr:hypothetical protein [Mangrovibacterium diazotrophicum]RKD86140.1 hypothetical protein BC643_4457 [Mangrovibacterium diazotrophicum]